MAKKTKAIELSCVVSGQTRRADDSLSIRLQTMGEAPVDLVTWLDSRHKKEVIVMIADDLKAQALSYKGELNKKKQSRSQQLRNAIYNLYNHLVDQGQPVPEWQIFYDMTMDDIIGEFTTY